MYRCVKCGACHAVCPTYQATGDEAQVARGRLSLLEAVLDGRLELTRGLDRRLSRCIGCLACDAVCPSGVRVHAAILAAKADLTADRHSHRLARLAIRHAAQGSSGPGVLMRRAGAIGETAYRKLPGNRLAPWRRDGHKRSLPSIGRRTLADTTGDATAAANPVGRVAYFPGCATNLLFPATGMATIKVLNRAGFTVEHPRGLECCGLPFLSLGDREAAREAAGHNLALLAALDADLVVTACSSCALMLRELLPELLGSDREDARALAASVRDIHELLADGTLDIAPRETPPLKVTWHDPCHMRHGLGLTSQPREAIAGLAGIEYVDTAPGCCGGAGAFSFLHYDLALKIGAGRAEEIAASGADIVATGCPGCRLHLTDVLGRAGSPVRVTHTIELIADRL
ncbi:MAG: (Fe-S)-binding protein [Thermoleophilia bacterium]